jgi:glycine cleavage system protein P-like pyridoxal-binding family
VAAHEVDAERRENIAKRLIDYGFHALTTSGAVAAPLQGL